MGTGKCLEVPRNLRPARERGLAYKALAIPMPRTAEKLQVSVMRYRFVHVILAQARRS